MKLHPLRDQMIVRPTPGSDKTNTGIFLPDTAVDDSGQDGVVIATGRLVVDIKVGDHIIFSKYSGTEVKIEEENLLIVSEKVVLAIIERHTAGVVVDRETP